MWVKEGRQKRRHAVKFHLYKTVENSTGSLVTKSRSAVALGLGWMESCNSKEKKNIFRGDGKFLYLDCGYVYVDVYF